MLDDDGESERPEQQQMAWVCCGGQLVVGRAWNSAVLPGTGLYQICPRIRKQKKGAELAAEWYQQV